MNVNIFLILFFISFSYNKKLINNYHFSNKPTYDKSFSIKTNEITTSNYNFDSISIKMYDKDYYFLFCIDFFDFFSPSIDSKSVYEEKDFEINGKKIIFKFISYDNDINIKNFLNNKDININGFQVKNNSFIDEIYLDKNYSIVGLNHDQLNTNTFLTMLQDQNFINYGSLVYNQKNEIKFGAYPDEFREEKSKFTILTCQTKEIIKIGWSCNSQYLVFGDFDFKTIENWEKQSALLNHIIIFTSLVDYHIFPLDLYKYFENFFNEFGCFNITEENLISVRCENKNIKRFGIVINGTLLEFKQESIFDGSILKIKFANEYKYIQLSIKLLLSSNHKLLFDDYLENIKIVNDDDFINVSNYTGYEKVYSDKIYNIFGFLITLLIISVLGSIFYFKKTWKEEINLPFIPDNYLRIIPKIDYNN